MTRLDLLYLLSRMYWLARSAGFSEEEKSDNGATMAEVRRVLGEGEG